MVAFADTSHFQSVDLAAYKAAGYDRIVIKATGGALDGSLQFADPTFTARWQQAGQLGLARVAYHFARNGNTGGDEFAWCWSQIQAAGGLGPHDVLCYDQEDSRTAATIATARQRTVEFVAAAVRAGLGYGWVYSGRWFLEPAGIVAADLPAGWRNLWISDYTAGQADTAIEVPAGWTRDLIVARQWSSTEAFPGIPAPCDANRVLREWIQEAAMPMTEADSALFWGHDVNTAAGIQPAWRALSDAQTQAVAARDAANAAKTAAAQAVTLAQQNTAALAGLATQVAALPGGAPDPAAVAAAIDLQALAAVLAPQLAAHIQLKAV